MAHFEHAVAKVTKNSRKMPVDISWLHVPKRLAEFSSMLTAGFVVQALGDEPVFAASGGCFAIFLLSLPEFSLQESIDTKQHSLLRLKNNWNPEVIC